MNTDSNNESGQPRRWELSRIASAAVLVLIALGGLAYGIYSLIGNSTPSNSGVNAPPASSTRPTQSVSPNSQLPSNYSSVSGTPSLSNNAAQNSSSSSGVQLSNTGPGNVALYGFVIASLLGTVGHYGWRRHHRRTAL